MLKLEVFDPPMCCATGICGNSVDPKLVTFASDLEWLKKQGIDVVRHGLSFEPDAFVKNDLVKNMLQQKGNGCLPIVFTNNQIVSDSCYPNRKTLAEICGIEWKNEYDTQEATPVEIETCGPDCDCHNSALSDNMKKVLFIIVLLIMAGIIAVKMSCKVSAAQVEQIIPVKNQAATIKFGSNINSTNQLKSSADVAFVFIPSKENEGISVSAKNAAISTQNVLKDKNIKVNLYTLKTTSAEYLSLASQANPPSIVVIKGQNKSFVSGEITQAKLLQAYMTVIQTGCGAGCGCHKK